MLSFPLPAFLISSIQEYHISKKYRSPHKIIPIRDVGFFEEEFQLLKRTKSRSQNYLSKKLKAMIELAR
ncbi:hypothetical protein [Leptospira borgpetersenii]|uniref:hypothetical protein n=1 Tax=Leptospira borgpetersenii TaxID=174 RepID=UPI0002F9FA93|nr:hypothetical protein [Leptospira borgpetersenii]